MQRPSAQAEATSPAAFGRLEVEVASRREALARKLEDITLPICIAHGVELVCVVHAREPGGAVIRVILDRDGAGLPGSGVSLEDCTNVSRDLATALDVTDAVPGAYRLEVSSPGLERPLVKLADFERFAGREARIKTRDPVGDRRNFRGVLKGTQNETIQLEQDGTVFEIPFAEVAKANLVHRF